MGKISKSTKKSVFIVHCIDTEGPLYESTSATFQRLKDLFAIDVQKLTKSYLDDLKKEI